MDADFRRANSTFTVFLSLLGTLEIGEGNILNFFNAY